jgi:glycosyltransferase involved in cell wall biosynthesis
VAENKGRIAIVYPWPNLDTVPSLCNASYLLAQQGYEVDIFTHASDEFKTPTFNNGINLKVLRHVPSTPRAIKKLWQSAQLCKGRVLSLLLRVYRALKEMKHMAANVLVAFRHSKPLRELHRSNPYRCFIGVDPEGLAQAHLLAKPLKVPVAYYSLELLLSQELSSAIEERLKKREISLSRKAPFIIIQDKDRARLLAEDNEISNDQFVLVPNAPLGPARRRRSNYWHEQFDLPSDFHVVLHTGSVEEWTGVREIVQSVKCWPEHWVLVVHTRYQGESSSDVAELRKLALPGRVVFSLKPVPRQEYDRLVDGADIGIAFYVPQPGSPYTQLNIQAIGLASGKMAYYLRAGLPVIVNGTTSLGELVRREGCGISIEKGQDIGNAIARITAKYDMYSERACQGFTKNFEFAHQFEEVINRLDSLSREYGSK